MTRIPSLTYLDPSEVHVLKEERDVLGGQAFEYEGVLATGALVLRQVLPELRNAIDASTYRELGIALYRHLKADGTWVAAPIQAAPAIP